MLLHRKFLAGDEVEVRSEAEILATLDPQGRLEGLPFMPEMLQYCGRRFRVWKRAEKTCDTIGDYTSRRMLGAVHLEGLRCTGEAHGGCQARCLIFWKDEWLRKVGEPPVAGTRRKGAPHAPVSREGLGRACRRPSALVDGADLFVCQATEMTLATTPMTWWEPRQYVREVAVGNVSLMRLVRVMARAAYNAVARRLLPLGVRPRPWLRGRPDPDPTALLGLLPGDRVRVRPLSEIQRTLDRQLKSRGLSFDAEMAVHAGREYTVQRRVERLIDERTGRMLRISKDCIVLDGVTCGGCLSQNRLFCPRSIESYWREGWLERVPGPAAPSASGSPADEHQ